ncbi:MAG: hypothetical protein ACYC64_12125 [Armatimonadota bacterium]
MPEMIIRSGKDTGTQLVYAAGKFAEDDAYVVSQAGGASPFGGALCCPGSEYVVEMTPDGMSTSWLGKTQIVSSAAIGKAWYIKDQESGEAWSAFYNPVCTGADEYEVSYLPGSVRLHNLQNKIACTLTITVSPEHPCEIWHVKLENRSAQDRTLRFTTYVEPAVGSPPETRYLKQDKLLLMRRPLESIDSDRSRRGTPNLVLFHSSTLPAAMCQVEKDDFVGAQRSLCNPMQLEVDTEDDIDGIAVKAVASFSVDIHLPIEGEAEFGFCFGAATTADEAAEIARSLSKTDAIRDAMDATQAHWNRLSSSLKVQTQDPALDALINTWLPYEAYAGSAKNRAENATPEPSTAADGIRRFQPMGANAAYLFREALVDFAGRLSVTGVYLPDEFSQIAMPPQELLWLAICTANYVAETGNVGMLSQTVAFRDGVIMSLGEHCERAIRNCANQSCHSGDELLEQALELWSFVKPTDEFTDLLEIVRNRRASGPKEHSEERSLPRRMRYLQSVCPTLSEAPVANALSNELDETSCDSRTNLAAYSAVVQKMLGITATNEGLVLKPRFPESWFECMIVRRFRGDTYNIHIRRSANPSKKGNSIVVDGEPVLGDTLPMFGDGGEHQVDVTVG